MEYSDTIKDILRYIKRECRAYKVRVVLTKGKKVVADGDKCQGYFSDTQRVIKVAGGCPVEEWFPVLLHEYRHFTQWRDHFLGRRTRRAKLWQDTIDHPFYFGFNTRPTKRGLYAIIRLEQDAERFSISVMRRLKIFSKQLIDEMAREASLYLFSHHFIWEKNRWFKSGQGISSWLKDEALWAEAPTSLRGDFTKVPRRLRFLIRDKF